MKMYKFQIHKIIFSIVILYLIFIILTLRYKHQIENSIVNNDVIQQVKDFQLEENFFNNHPELKPTEGLIKNFTNGINNCGNKRTAFETEFCSWEFVKSKSINDYKKLEKIRYYCLYNTKCEYDRRKCIDDIIGFND